MAQLAVITKPARKPPALKSARTTAGRGTFDDAAFRLLFASRRVITDPEVRAKVFEGLYEIGRIAATRINRLRCWDVGFIKRANRKYSRRSRIGRRSTYSKSIAEILAGAGPSEQLADARAEAVKLAIEKFDAGCFKRTRGRRGNPDPFAYFYKIIFREILRVLRRERARDANHDPRGTDALREHA
jgi:hypothetical protein